MGESRQQKRNDQASLNALTQTCLITRCIDRIDLGYPASVPSIYDALSVLNTMSSL